MLNLQLIKESVDIVRVATALGIRLNYSNKALCPFHKEKTPSFSVSTEKQIYHCFGCGKSGDSISLVQDMLGLSVMDAARWLNATFNLNITTNMSDYQMRLLRQKVQARERFKKDELHTFIVLTDYYRLLVEQDNVETWQNIDKVDYYTDVLINGTDKDKLKLLKDNRKWVETIEQRLLR